MKKKLLMVIFTAIALTFVLASCGHEHTFEVSSETPATCDIDGVRVLKCTDCGEEQTETLPKTGHIFEEISVPSTCSKQGYTAFKCSACDYEENKVSLPKASHNYVEDATQSVPANCTDAGRRVLVCSICQGSKTETVTALGHSETTKVIAPTCEDYGYTLHYCERCEAELERTDMVNPAGEHAWVADPANSTPADCMTGGVDAFVCSACGATKTENTSPAGHATEVAGTRVPATCGADAYTPYICPVCTAVIRTETETGSATGEHDWTRDTANDVPATCVAGGKQAYICSVCSTTKADDTDPTGVHVYGTLVTQTPVPSTCEKKSYNVYKCNYCDETSEVEVEGATLAAHTFAETQTAGSAQCAVCEKLFYDIDYSTVAYGDGQTITIGGETITVTIEVTEEGEPILITEGALTYERTSDIGIVAVIKITAESTTDSYTVTVNGETFGDALTGGNIYYVDLTSAGSITSLTVTGSTGAEAQLNFYAEVVAE